MKQNNDIQAALDAINEAEECFQPETLEELRDHFNTIRAALTAQQPDVKDENNTNVLCYNCGKTYEHEYNQPPRHGSCEVCGRKKMFCTRVMTRKARAEQKG